MNLPSAGRHEGADEGCKCSKKSLLFRKTRRRRRRKEIDFVTSQNLTTLTSNHLSKCSHLTRANLNVASMLLTILTLVPMAIVVANANNGSQDTPLAQAEALTQSQLISNSNPLLSAQQAAAAISTTQSIPTTNNVIIIKYSNVTTNPQEDSYQQQELNVFRLYDQPLSVSVIESKFSHSIDKFDVSFNQLSTLSKDLFCPLSNQVKSLNISHNLLENFDCLGLISQAGQLCLSELKTLDMSYNLIKHLPATGVATLHNLEILNLSHNLLETLDELSLSSLFKLNNLDLSYNRLQQLPMRLFQKSSKMTHLNLQFNNLQVSISQIFLAGLYSLEEINLSFNNISHLSDSAFVDKINLTHVDLRYNQLTGLRQEALRVTSLKLPSSTSNQAFKHRLHHNGQFAGLSPKQQVHSQSASAVFYLASNPFICDCNLEWIRKIQPSNAIKSKSVLSSSFQVPNSRIFNQTQQDSNNYDQYGSQLMQLSSSNVQYQNDQPFLLNTDQLSSGSSSNNISEILSNGGQQAENSNNQIAQQRPMATLISTASQQQQQHYAQIGDLDLMKCTPLFRRNNQRNNNNGHYRAPSRAPSDGSSYVGSHHFAHHHHNHHHYQTKQQTDNMIDILGADSSNFLCRYKNHCFALCHCCEFDACDCEMICPNGCNCYYDLTWQTNIIDCSSNNHTAVPDRIPMDVKGLYLDGNNIESLKPSNLIARRSLKTLYLNSTNLQFIANRTFNGLIELQTLYLNNNLIRTLNGYEFEPLAQLRALYLQSNRLDYINNQTFIFLRSLEMLDLSNNRLTSSNLDLFWSIGHQNIRLRQLNIAHNWWSCQCSSINRFRQILKQKFLLNGSVNIADKNQLRCYYNQTTVGPLILAENLQQQQQQQQPLYASYQNGQFNRQQQQHQQQTLLTEINQCSDSIEDEQRLQIDFNPPMIHIDFDPTLGPIQPNEPFPNDAQQQQNQSPQQYQNPFMSPPISDQPSINSPPPMLHHHQYSGDIVSPNGGFMRSSGSGLNANNSSSNMPLTSFLLLSILFAGVMIIIISIFVFIRQQQRFNPGRHKKSSAGSTTSASSSASSTAISSLNNNNNANANRQHFQQQRHHQTLHNPHHHHHLIMRSGAHGGTTTSSSINQHILQHNHHSASSQSNIYAALVSPTTGNSTTVTNMNSNNLYSNSSTTASHHSNSPSHGVVTNGGYPHQQWQSTATNQQSFYNNNQTYSTGRAASANLGLAMENHYAINASQASYKTGGSLYGNSHDLNTPTILNGSGANLGLAGVVAGQPTADWIKLPKVKQFMSKLVNKSLAFGGYHRACSRDELSSITSDKIYDAFISYDKRDEAFVMQHLSAELEYGQPQYRIADRFRDLPAPTSTYIAEAITSVIGCSHRTIIVLTDNYLNSEWCRYELQAALQEASLDKSHKLIAIVLDPKCLLEMDSEIRNLLTNNSTTLIYQQQQQQQQQQLVQLADEQQQQQVQQHLVATLSNGGQVSTQTAQLATSKISFLNYNDHKFWSKIKQLMPQPRPTNQTLTLTTKN